MVKYSSLLHMYLLPDMQTNIRTLVQTQISPLILVDIVKLCNRVDKNSNWHQNTWFKSRFTSCIDVCMVNVYICNCFLERQKSIILTLHQNYRSTSAFLPHLLRPYQPQSTLIFNFHDYSHYVLFTFCN